jgi:transcriptional regulator with XRE-family HTH domain
MSRMGLEVARLRSEKGMTQKQLGKLIGTSEGFINEVEDGKKVLNSDLLTRIYKVLGRENVNTDLDVSEKTGRSETGVKKAIKVAEKPVQQVWSDALENILKTVSIYGYKMDKVINTKQLPVISNKVEGCAKDKVFYLQIEDNDMLGFRIAKGDLALAFSTQEVENDAIYFIQYNSIRVIRQVKRLDRDKLLLISNKGSLLTETVADKDIKVFAKLIRLEVIL